MHVAHSPEHGPDLKLMSQVTEWLKFRDSEGGVMSEAKLQKVCCAD